MGEIPKVIHYCWFGGQPLPELAVKCIESWKKHCPDYEIIRWDESNFNIHCNSYVDQAYQAEKWAFVTDYARLLVVYEHGGIYLDTDVELLKPLDELLEYSGFMGFENGKHINTGLGFGAFRHNAVIQEILKDYESASFIKDDGSFDLTPCTYRNTKVLVKLGLQANNTKQLIDGLAFLPTEYLSPKDYESGKLEITSNSYSIHHFNASWLTGEEIEWYTRGSEYRNRYGKLLGRVFLVVTRYGFIGAFKLVIRKTKT